MSWSQRYVTIRLVDLDWADEPTRVLKPWQPFEITSDACAPASERWQVQAEPSAPAVTYPWWAVILADEDNARTGSPNGTMRARFARPKSASGPPSGTSAGSIHKRAGSMTSSAALYFNRSNIGQPFDLDGIEVQLVRETSEAIYPYHRFTVVFIAEPTTAGRCSAAHQTTRHELGDDWSSDLTWSERLVECMRQAGLEAGRIEHLLELAHQIRTNDCALAYGEPMPVRCYTNHCTACDRRWTTRIASFTLTGHQEWDHCPDCYTGPYATYNED